MKIWLAALCLILVIATPVCAAENAPNLAEATLQSVFLEACNNADLTFNSIVAHAEKNNLYPLSHNTGTTHDGIPFRDAAWALSLPDAAPLMLLAGEMTARGHVSLSCAITGSEVDAAKVRRQTVLNLGLEKTPKPLKTADGTLSFVWHDTPRKNITLLIRDFTAAGRNEAMLKIMVKRPQP